jgi:hypothetical protein
VSEWGRGFKKGVGRVGRWPGEARRGRVHGGACGREVREMEGADGWRSQASERGRANGRARCVERMGHMREGDLRRHLGPTGQRKRGSGCAGERE